MARGDFPSSKQDQFVLRFPEGLRDKVKDAAEESGRSMNAEIITRIEAYDSGGDVAEEWKRRFEEEHQAYKRIEALYDGTLDVAMNYRDLLGTAKGQVLQHAGIIKSLASMIQNLDGPPPPELVDLASRLETAASETKERLTGEAELAKAHEELRKTDAAIEKADTLLNNPKKR
jgi:hypothetical protein